MIEIKYVDDDTQVQCMLCHKFFVMNAYDNPEYFAACHAVSHLRDLVKFPTKSLTESELMCLLDIINKGLVNTQSMYV